MRLVRAVGASAIVLSVLAGCGGSARGAVSLGSGAAGDVARLLGVSVADLEVPPGVLDDVARVPASHWTTSRSWRTTWRVRAAGTRSRTGPRSCAASTSRTRTSSQWPRKRPAPAFEADRDPTLGDVNTAVVHRFGIMPTRVELQELVDATRDLHEGMGDAAAEGEHARASVLLYFYVFNDIPEVG